MANLLQRLKQQRFRALNLVKNAFKKKWAQSCVCACVVLCVRGLQYALIALFLSSFAPSLLSPSVLVSLSPENPAIVCPIQVFTAFVSLTTADPEWEPIVCEQPLTCQSLGPALHHPQGSLKESLEKSKATFGHLKS